MDLHITSRENERVKWLCRLRDSASFRQREQCYLAEGLRLCRDIAHVQQPVELYYTEKAMMQHPELVEMGGRHICISDGVADKISDTKNPQGIFGVFGQNIQTLDRLCSSGRWLILEHLQDPANIGALLRSAAAFGFDGVVFCADCADPYSPKAVRASMGMLTRLKLAKADTVAQTSRWLKKEHVPLVAAALYHSVPLDQAESWRGQNVALLIGNEGNGLSEGAVKVADIAVRIPMANGVESLNAAVAGSVLLWHFRGV
ncbi:TrmH family RNA methyltransferase [uncultured Ruthenibacterium sp.]|uniref:TrmH family RNA methyltransferase n=1 Tax=uncultured Ruthenibacterium sp. TaxID=1905347 RepID=UPI00349EC36F